MGHEYNEKVFPVQIPSSIIHGLSGVLFSHPHFSLIEFAIRAIAITK